MSSGDCSLLRWCLHRSLYLRWEKGVFVLWFTCHFLSGKSNYIGRRISCRKECSYSGTAPGSNICVSVCLHVSVECLFSGVPKVDSFRECHNGTARGGPTPAAWQSIFNLWSTISNRQFVILYSISIPLLVIDRGAFNSSRSEPASLSVLSAPLPRVDHRFSAAK